MTGFAADLLPILRPICCRPADQSPRSAAIGSNPAARAPVPSLAALCNERVLIMSGHEEQLHTRAELLEETSELAAAVTAILDGASGGGIDPRAIVSLRGAVTALDPGRRDSPVVGPASRSGPAPGRRLRVRC